MNRVIQCNINRNPRAFDLLTQMMAESGIGIAAISEPPFVPNKTNWYSSKNKLAAIFWRPRDVPNNPIFQVFQGINVIVVQIGDINIASCYVSPNINRGEFLLFIDELDDMLARVNGRMLV